MAQLIVCIGSVMILLVLATLAQRSEKKHVPQPDTEIFGDAALLALTHRPLKRRRSKLHLKQELTPLLKRTVKTEEPIPVLALAKKHARVLCAQELILREKLRNYLPLPVDVCGVPRLVLFCSAALSKNDAANEKTLLHALHLWQAEATLTHAEREQLPLIAQTVFIHRLQALLRRGLLDAQAWREGLRLARRLAHTRRAKMLLDTIPWEQNVLVYALLRALQHDAQNELLAAAERMLARCGLTRKAVTELFSRRADEAVQEFACTVKSMEALSHLDWPHISEAEDPVHQLFKGDPAALYGDRMTEKSRNTCRRETQRLADWFGTSETEIAHACITLANEHIGDVQREHIGFYLLEKEGAAELRQYLNARHGRIRLWIHHHREMVQYTVMGIANIAAAVLVLLLGYAPWLLALFLPIWSVGLHTLINCVTRRFFPSSPRLQLNVSEITEECRTLLVLPCTLTEPAQAVHMVRQLLTAREACPPGAIDCLLLSDYTACMTCQSGGDTAIVSAVQQAISALDAPTRHFFYMQRQRAWNEKLRCFAPRGGRHGALDALNHLLADGMCSDTFDAATIPPNTLHRRYAYVLSIREDTLPIPDSVTSLIGLLAHPLNQRIQTRHGAKGISILCPRLACRLHTNDKTLSLMQHEEQYNEYPGIHLFEGVGLYHPAALLESTAEQLPKTGSMTLSMLEGLLAGCMTDPQAVFTEDTSETVEEVLEKESQRAWAVFRLLPWLFPYVKDQNGARKNPLSKSDKRHLRAQILETLLPLCQMGLLLFSAFAHEPGLLLFVLFWPKVDLLLKKRWQALPGILARLCLLPRRSAGYVHTLLQRLSQHRQAHSSRKFTLPESIGTLTDWSQVFAAILTGVLAIRGIPEPLALFISVLFAAYPLMIRRLETPFRPQAPLDPQENAFVMEAARKTWCFFDETMVSAHHFLPPSALQVDPAAGMTGETSAQAIGYGLLACVSACMLGILSPEEMAQRLSRQCDTLEALPKWHGMLYAHYGLADLVPVDPAQIRTEDCGLVCAALMCAAQMLRAQMHRLSENHQALPARLDELAGAMDFAPLMDRSAGLLVNGVSLPEEVPFGHIDSLASSSLPACFLAILRRAAPPSMLESMMPLAVKANGYTTFLSARGSMAEYLAPALLLPYPPLCALERSLHGAISAQIRHNTDGVFGVSSCMAWGFTTGIRYRPIHAGLNALALHQTASENVVAPYASALCLSFAAEQAVHSLIRLKGMGAMGRLGFFDSVDMERGHLPEGTKQMIVKCYDAAHQGMTLCAACNALVPGGLQALFCSLPGVDAWLSILHHLGQNTHVLPPIVSLPENVRPPEASFARTAQTLCTPVDAFLLGGGGSTLLVTAQGAGALFRNGQCMTCFTGRAIAAEGPRLYVMDGTNIFQPTDPTLKGEVRFEEGHAAFCRRAGWLQMRLSVTVEPLHGQFVQALTLENRAAQEHVVEVASIVPLDPKLAGNCVQRSAANVLTCTLANGETLRYTLQVEEGLEALTVCTDAVRFWSGDVYHPAGFMQSMADILPEEPEQPCFSFRARIRLPGRSQQTLVFLTGTQKYSWTDASQLEEILMLAKLHSRVLTDSVGLNQRLAGELSRAFGMLLFSGQTHQGAVAPLVLPASSLAALGLGDEKPILTLYIASEAGCQLVLQSAQLAGWMALLGLPVHLCVLCQGGGAAQALHTAETLLAAAPLGTSDAKAWRASALPDNLRATLDAASRLILYEGMDIRQQLDNMTVPLLPLEESECRGAHSLPAENLLLKHGSNGFQEQTGDPVFLLENDRTCVPETVLHMVAEDDNTLQAGATGFHGTTCGNDILTEGTDSECFLVEEKGAWHSLTPAPMGGGASYRTQFGAGMVSYHSIGNELDISLTAAWIPGRCCGMRIVHIDNRKQEKRKLRLLLGVRFRPGGHTAEAFLTPVTNGVTVQSPHIRRTGWLFALESTASVRIMSETSFAGLWGKEVCVAGHEESMGTVAVLEQTIHLNGMEHGSAIFLLGMSQQMDDAEAACQEVQSNGASAMLRSIRQQWSMRLGRLWVQTPDAGLNLLVNRILPYAMRALPTDLLAIAAWAMTEPKQAVERLLQMAGNSSPLLPLVVWQVAAHCPDTAFLEADIASSSPHTLHDACREALSAPVDTQNAEALLLRFLGLEAYASVFGADEKTHEALDALQKNLRPKNVLRQDAFSGKQVMCLAALAFPEDDALMQRIQALPVSGRTYTMEDALAAAALASAGRWRAAWEHIPAADAMYASAGTAALAYMTIMEGLLGMEWNGNTLALHAHVPEAWDSLTLTLHAGASTWHVEAARAIRQASCDGEKAADPIAIHDDGHIHQVRFPLN